MKAAAPSLPARILKRAEVDAGLSRQSAHDAAVPAPDPAGPGAPPARTLTKEARLLPRATGGSLLEVRCSCGEWTRLELNTGERGLAGEHR
ncbi:MAG: hypothetical protein ACKVXR_12500 [Planctomycetota bacterium]